jgi:hypothetical protein
MRKFLLNLIDFFHPPFARFIPKATFRYLATGGSTAAMGVIVYFIAYNFVLQQQGIRLPFIYISGPIAALILELCITFPLGFLLNKYLVFTQSNLRGRIQLMRYDRMYQYPSELYPHQNHGRTIAFLPHHCKIQHHGSGYHFQLFLTEKFQLWGKSRKNKGLINTAG